MTSPNTPKWIPKHNVETKRLFDQSKQLDREMRFLCHRFSQQDIHLEMQDVYEFDELISQSRHCFEASGNLQVSLLRLSGASSNKNFDRSPYKVLQSRKAVLLRQNLKRQHFQLIFQLHNMMCFMLTSCVHTELVIESSLKICCLLNETITFVSTMNIHKAGGAQICSNTFPAIMSLPKNIDIGMVLQIVCKQRSEQCCLQLITCMIAGYRAEMMTPNQESDTSSVEILRTITHNLQSPINGLIPAKSVSVEAKPKLVAVSQEDDPSINFFDNLVNQLHNQPQFGDPNCDAIELLHRLIHEEENFMANVMIKCIRICPSVFGDKPLSREELVKWINRGSRSLWTQVGGTLDHVLLWWSNAPVASQPISHAKYLRDWLLVLQPDDAPEPILSTLKRLGESLTMHVTTTTWDRQFSAAIVTAATLPIDITVDNCPHKPEHGSTTSLSKLHSSSTCGLLWRDVLKSLVKLANSCDNGGTIPNELPIVEQIPILHRLDHSIHSMRLWAAEQSKALCTDWNMLMFFKVVHGDIGVCLLQLAELRVPQMVPPGPLDVHVQVCVALRAKLVSEIKINIEKLKKQTGECIDVLSSICMTCSLATLSLCFPQPKSWQCELVQTSANDYVKYFLDQIYLPVLESGIQELEILGLILKIICEAWLDHIYASRTKFSRSGALNLLKDFDGVSEYISTCKAVPPQHVDKLAKHEVLKMCEGVGRILLRKPEDLIQMAPDNPKKPIPGTKSVAGDKFGDADLMDERPPLPPEMFVPNQKRWLELRAKDRSAFTNLLCLCGSNSSVVTSNAETIAPMN